MDQTIMTKLRGMTMSHVICDLAGVSDLRVAAEYIKDLDTHINGFEVRDKYQRMFKFFMRKHLCVIIPHKNNIDRARPPGMPPLPPKTTA